MILDACIMHWIVVFRFWIGLWCFPHWVEEFRLVYTLIPPTLGSGLPFFSFGWTWMFLVLDRSGFWK